MDLTPYLDSLQGSNLDEVLLSVAVNGKVALAMKGRFFLRCLCDSFREPDMIGCAVTEIGAKMPMSRSTTPPPARVIKLIEVQSTIPEPLKEARLKA